MEQFPRVHRLPPYVFAVVNELKARMRHQGEDIIDLGMGNPDLATPKHIVDKLCEAAHKATNHRYSASKGIPKLRLAICDWYWRRYGVELNPDQESVVTLGAKEGLAHLAMVMLSPGDVVFAQDPTYPIHPYSAIIAGADVRRIPIGRDRDFFEDLMVATRQTWPQPKVLIISYPHNPTTQCVDLAFFEKIVDFAKEHKMYVIHDLAYADLTFDGYQAPSFLQAKGAKDVGVEFFSLSKSYSMAGWRVGFCAGNRDMVQALTRIKSYLDYGMFQPVQIAAIIALNGPQDCVQEIVETYKDRRDALIEGLHRIGWDVPSPKGTMFVWAQIPEEFRSMGSVEFSKLLLREGKVAVSPGLGFGNYGDDHVRFALVENRHRINQAIRGLRKVISGGIMSGELIRLGLAGLGTVGTGLAKILASNADWIERRLGRRVTIKTALVRDPSKARDVPEDMPIRLTADIQDLLGDPELDVIVELMGGKDTAYELITKSLRSGRHVVTANKALLAERGNELFALAAEKGVGLGFEASIAGGIPIVQTLKEGLAGNRIKVLTGILNGTANFILSEMTSRGLDFQTALRQAQVKGYAEADPTLDIEGLDAAHKLILLIRLAHGQDYPLSSLQITGITHVDPQDIAFAEEFGYRIKLIAQVRETDGLLDAGVFTALVRREAILGKVDGPFNAILLDGDAVGPIMLYGQGAGDLPTGSAVLADIMSLVRNGRAPDNTGFQNATLPPAHILPPALVRSRHYFRFSVQDRPGVLASIAGMLGQRNISIAQVVQKGSPTGSCVPVVIVTHKALAQDVQAAVGEIDGQSFITAPTVHHRILPSPA